MGYLHEGHLSLMKRARKIVGPDGALVTSIYVNPTQFAAHEDLGKYPRDFRNDSRLCRSVGVDVLFAPSDTEIYPGKSTGDYSTYVSEEELSQGMEGSSRPTHFRGVTTVVAKLFNLVLPDVAVFGAKDFQQAAVIRRMTVDLNFPVRIVVAPTCRESDGLAMSSRNAYLTPAQRAQATCLIEAIRTSRRMLRERKGGVDPSDLKTRLKGQIESRPEARVDYIAFVDPATLKPAERVTRGTQLALAVRVGRTRLIDNASL